MQNKLRLISLLLIISYLLSACSLPFIKDGKLSLFQSQVDPTTTPAAVPTLDPNAALPEGELARCLVGSWEVQDISGFTTMIHPAWVNLPDAWKDRQLTTVNSASGKMVLTFDGQGNLYGTGTDYQVDATVEMVGLSLDLNVLVNGTGKANYAVDEVTKVISFTNPAGVDMAFTIGINGATMLKDVAANDMAVLQKIKRSGLGFRFACQDDTIRIEVEASDMEAIPQAVTLKKITQ